MASGTPTTVVFCGPTISGDEVRRVLTAALGTDPGNDLVTAAPVAQGDVIEAVRRHHPHTLVVIDGVFDRVPAVWHKELLWAMDRGVHTFGAASMGALRAAELHPFGMIGVGQVFEWFRDSTLDDDDEVAVTHTLVDEGFRPLSTAMVDLRHHLAMALDATVIDHAQADGLLRIAKDLPYPQRSVPAVLALAVRADADFSVALDEAAIEWLLAAGGDRSRSRKHLDALECLAVVAAHLETTADPFRPEGWYVEPTVFLTNAIHVIDQGLDVAPGANADNGATGADITLIGDGLPVLRKQALLRLLARDLAAVRGIRLDDADVQAVVHNFRRRYALEEAEQFERWLVENGLSWPEVAAALTDIALVDRVERAFHLQVDGAVAPLARFAAARRATPDRNHPPGEP